MMDLSPDSLVIKVRAPQPECALSRCLSTLRSNLMLPLRAALQVVLVTPRAVRAHAKKDLSKDYGVQAPGSQG
jgi:hypothetical protein